MKLNVIVRKKMSTIEVPLIVSRATGNIILTLFSVSISDNRKKKTLGISFSLSTTELTVDEFKIIYDCQMFCNLSFVFKMKQNIKKKYFVSLTLLRNPRQFGSKIE